MSKEWYEESPEEFAGKWTSSSSLHETIERRLLAPYQVALLLDNGSLALMNSNTGAQITLDAAAAFNLLDLLYDHRDLLHRLEATQAGTHEQESPQKLDPGMGTR